MAYGGNRYNPSRQDRDLKFSMASYSQDYNPHDWYSFDDNYSMSQMGRGDSYSMAQMGKYRSYSMSQMGRLEHNAQQNYGNQRPRRNELPPRKKRNQEKRFVKGSEEAHSNKKLMHQRRLSQAGKSSEAPPRVKLMNRKRLSQNSPVGEGPSKRSKVADSKSERRNSQRKRSFRGRRNFRRPRKEEATPNQDGNTLKCLPCSTKYRSAEEHRDHLKSESHRMKSAEYYFMRKLPLGFDNEEPALEPVKAEEVDPKKSAEYYFMRKLPLGFDNEEPALEPVKAEEVDPKTREGEMTVEDEPEEAMETDKVEANKENVGNGKKGERQENKEQPNPWGVSAVVRVTGFYCKLCRMFFRNANIAKKKHCSSAMHYEAYKAMKVALKEEEDRVRLAEDEITAADIASEQGGNKSAASIIEEEVATSVSGQLQQEDGMLVPELDAADDDQVQLMENKEELQDDTSSNMNVEQINAGQEANEETELAM